MIFRLTRNKNGEFVKIHPGVLPQSRFTWIYVCSEIAWKWGFGSKFWFVWRVNIFKSEDLLFVFFFIRNAKSPLMGTKKLRKKKFLAISLSPILNTWAVYSQTGLLINCFSFINYLIKRPLFKMFSISYPCCCSFITGFSSGWIFSKSPSPHCRRT